MHSYLDERSNDPKYCYSKWQYGSETIKSGSGIVHIQSTVNSLNAELNPICYLLALLGAHHLLHVSRIRVNKSYDSPLWVQTRRTL